MMEKYVLENCWNKWINSCKAIWTESGTGGALNVIMITELHKNYEINPHNFSIHVLELLPDTPVPTISNEEDPTNRLI
jgi:thiol-disulfide isomerase/thioredoxin